MTLSLGDEELIEKYQPIVESIHHMAALQYFETMRASRCFEL